jgi:intein/homing endonuclease
MSWKKHFKPVTIDGHGSHSPISGGGRPGPAKTNYSSFLPDVYAGTPNRIDRYMQYDTMDMDSEVNAALDIIAEFCTQKDKENETPFHTSFRGQPTSTEVKLIKDCLQKWCKQQQFETRIFRIVRNTFKYGDCFFLRDPETKKWLYVDPVKVSKIIANESEGKIPEQYVIKDINFNFKNLIAVTPHGITNTSPSGTASYTSGGSLARGMVGDTARATGTRFQNAINEIAVDAKDVVHISLSEGLDNNFPFGNSLLESVFKVYKQKELLEDAVIIYRIQRAPERLVFYVDVGNMPAHLAMGFVERVKNEIQQRRIPSSTGGASGSTVDSSYNPLSVGENFYLPSTSEGRGSRVETLPGGCFAMDTKVSLLDGRELSIRDIETELKDGKTLWTYSCEPITGKVLPGLITWAGVTHKSAKVMKITLDNGETITCTPDHKFPVYEQEFKRADEFKVGDSLIPLYRKTEKVSAKANDYEQYFDNADKTWKFTHRTVADYLKDDVVKFEVYKEEYTSGLYEVRHHKNFNRFDNSPENLCFMGWRDHIRFHGENFASTLEYLKENEPELYQARCDAISLGHTKRWEGLADEDRAAVGIKSAEAWARCTPEEYDSWCESISEGLLEYCANLTPEEKEIRDANSRAAFIIGNQKFNEKMQNDPVFYAMVVGKRMTYWTPEKREWRAEQTRANGLVFRETESYKENTKKSADSQRMKYSHKMLKYVINLVKGKTTYQVGLTDVVNALNNDQEMLDELYELNKENTTPNWKVSDGYTESNVKTMVKHFGYEKWSDFRRKESIHNHTITAIEYLDDEIEVGTLTIDNDEKYHNYHTFALSCGVFVFNSQTGEITDLRYFTNKLFRALRIPASYLPTGIEEASNTVADGKVGTAYIQEFRFNEYCKRLQNLLVQTFDLEFKLWLYSQGINIDSSLFELKFNEPQNFAAYRQSELDTTRVNIFAQLQEIPYLSKRFAMKRFLGMTQEEITENEAMWREENGHKLESLVDGAGELRSAGISPSGIASDMSSQDEQAPEGVGQGPDGEAGGIGSAPGPMGNAAPGPTGGPMGM